MPPSIFITIPSYEDSRLLDTIEQAINKAKNPDKLHFAIALQYKHIQVPNLEKYYEDPRFDFVTYNVDTRPGVSQVRHNLLRFHTDQDYYLMIDSHSTFMPHWDEELVSDYQQLQIQHGERVVLSKQVEKFVGSICKCTDSKPAGGCLGHSSSVVFKVIGLAGLPISVAGKNSYVQIKNDINFYQHNYASCHFLFADSKFIYEVGILDSVHALFEELYLSFKSFMSGWKIYGQTRTHYIGHDNKRYNLEVYREQNPRKSYTKYYDTQETEDMLVEALLFNTGKFAIKDSKHSPADFWTAVGLHEEYLDAVKSVIS